MGYTTRGYPYPEYSSARDFPLDIKRLATWSDLLTGDLQTALALTDPATLAALQAWYDEAVGPDDAMIAAFLASLTSATRTTADGLYAALNDAYVSTAAHDVTDTTTLATALDLAHSESRRVLVSGQIALGGTLTRNNSVHMVGGPDATLMISHAGQGILIEPPSTTVGTCTSTALLSDTVTLATGSMTAGANTGKWVKIYDPSLAPGSGEPTTHWRRITTNTTTSITLEHPVGYAIPAGRNVEIIDPIDEVVLKDLTIDRDVVGSQNLVIRCVRNLVLDNVRVLNAGNYTAETGNGVSVYCCDRVTGTVESSKSGQFGVFLYNCDNINLDIKVDRWGGMFAAQMKDCRASRVRLHAVAVGGKGDDGLSIKCSGLNPSYDCHGTGYVSGVSQVGFQFSSITAEGSGFTADNFTFDNAHAHACGIGYSEVNDTGARTAGIGRLAYNQCTVRAATGLGFSVVTPRVVLTHPDAARCGSEGVRFGPAAEDSTMTGGLLTDNGQLYTSGANNSSDIRIDAPRVSLDTPVFVRTAAGKTIRAVREAGTLSVGTVITNPKIVDIAGGYAQDYVLTDPTSVVVGMGGADLFAGATTINKKPYFVGTPGPANADTSGASLVTLETEVNQVKALLRQLGFMGS